jgi:hypothetical protein
VEVPVHAHLVYAQLADRYVLVELDGPAPAVGSYIDVPDAGDRQLYVERVGRSPLPDDPRSCAFAYMAHVQSSEPDGEAAA